jgi:hypothetical protein
MEQHWFTGWNVPIGKRGQPFQTNRSFRKSSGWAVEICLFHLLSVWNHRNFHVNGKQPLFLSNSLSKNSPRMDHLHYRLNFDRNKSGQKFHYSLKEHQKLKLVIFQSFVPKCCKMRITYIALRSLPFFSHFVLQTGNWQPNQVLGHQFPVCNTKWLKIPNFARPYYSHFTTFRNDPLEYY